MKLKKNNRQCKDWFSINAIYWFNKKNDIESKFDICRGVKDKNGKKSLSELIPLQLEKINSIKKLLILNNVTS